MSLPVHDEETKAVLHRCGMSLHSELTREEKARMADAKAALEASPRIKAQRLYRILRPRTDNDEDSAL